MKRDTIIGILYIMVFLLAVSLKMRYEKTQDKSTERETIGASDSVSLKLSKKDKKIENIHVKLFVEEINNGTLELKELSDEGANALRLKMTKNNKSYFFKFKKMYSGKWSLITTNNINLTKEESIILHEYLGINDTTLAKAVNLKKYKTLVKNILETTMIPLNQVVLDNGYAFQLFKKRYDVENFNIQQNGLIIILPNSNQEVEAFTIDTLLDQSHRVDIIANGKLMGGRDHIYLEMYKSTDMRKALDAHYFELARGEGEFYIADVSLELNPPPYIGGPSTSLLTVANGSIDLTKTKLLSGSSDSQIEAVPGEDKKIRIRHARTLTQNSYSLQVASLNGIADTTWTFVGISKGGDAGNPCNWISPGSVITPIMSGSIYEDQDITINAGLEGECGIGKTSYTLQFLPNETQSIGASSTIEVPFGATQVIVTAKAPNGRSFIERATIASVSEAKNFKISANSFLNSSTPYIDVMVRNATISKNINFTEYKYVSGTLKLNGVPKAFKASAKGNNLQLILPEGNYANASISLELTLRNPTGKNITIMY